MLAADRPSRETCGDSSTAVLGADDVVCDSVEVEELGRLRVLPRRDGDVVTTLP